MQLQAALSSILPKVPPEDIIEKAVKLWPSYKDELLNSLQVRMSERTASLQRDLQNRADKEVADIRAILTELQRSIEKELEEPEFKQLELFNTEEKSQFERNVNSLRLRLEQIPHEIEQESGIIRSRFANPTPRLFPLAVTYLIPQKLIR
ncbi:hypothetical protein ACE1CI_31685 [Aerosakkonemataceae cyanobacterium BLCC-F50]|uniref:Uncharacterized protein n=1 Tax=Floridaenema flaviceps BLCC-F50 TaxID=3153642 RepID=A0ABV4Y0K3_9CYAN